jgi:hypothetical protein
MKDDGGLTRLTHAVVAIIYFVISVDLSTLLSDWFAGLEARFSRNEPIKDLRLPQATREARLEALLLKNNSQFVPPCFVEETIILFSPIKKS